MNNLLQRSLTGFFLVAVIVGCILAHYYVFTALCLFLTITVLIEFYRLLAANQIIVHKIYGIVVAIIILISSFIHTIGLVDEKIYLLTILPLLGIPVIELYRKHNKPFENIAYTITGILYIAMPFCLLNILPVIKQGNQYVYYSEIPLGFFILIWMYDTGAYLVGSAIGKHRLFERISPKKSWEGAIGGALIAALFAYLISLFFNVLQFADWLSIAVIIVITGTYGDLTESMLKRKLNIKDSGTFLPGHGGLLDRFDSVLFAAPAVFVYLRLCL